MERHFPLICGFRDLVEGNGFLAEVLATGRALAAQKEDGWWMYGVNPGALAASGKSLTEANLLLQQEFKKVLFDFATEAKNFEEFKKAVEKFFNETNEPTLVEWNAAVEAVRAGKIDLPELPRTRAESPLSINVLMRREFTSKKNRIEEEPRVAA